MKGTKGRDKGYRSTGWLILRPITHILQRLKGIKNLISAFKVPINGIGRLETTDKLNRPVNGYL